MRRMRSCFLEGLLNIVLFIIAICIHFLTNCLHKRDDASNISDNARRLRARQTTDLRGKKQDMQANKTVTINGRLYDAVTGLPVEAKKESPKTSASAPKRDSHVSATAIHTTTQRSQTLSRRAIKKPTVVKRPQPGRHMDISRSAKVARFAPHPVTAPAPKATHTPDIAPKAHPTATRALARVSAKQAKPVALSSKQVKEAAIAAAIEKPRAKSPKQRRFALQWSRRYTILTSIFAVLIVAAYITYVNIPSLSVGFAAAQAGVGATYPEYRPDGYSLKQPVTFRDGEVTLDFTSNSGAGGYTVVQSRSSWDSSAVLDNVVKKAVGDNYVTTQERGLTIYTYGSNAAWVNGGILYSISSSAPLSGEQIRHIATSL